MNVPLVVAVVLNWNLPGDTVRCVRSLLIARGYACRCWWSTTVPATTRCSALPASCRVCRCWPAPTTALRRRQQSGHRGGARHGRRLGAGAEQYDTAAPDMVTQLLAAGEAQQAALVARRSPPRCARLALGRWPAMASPTATARSRQHTAQPLPGRPGDRLRHAGARRRGACAGRL